MKKLPFVFALMGMISMKLSAQSYPPGAGFPGSTAIHADSSVFIDWAVSAEITRGYKNSALPESGFVDYGLPENAIGAPDGNEGVVSLGDDGFAVVGFNMPIVNGEGPDFAVFENGFYQNDTSELAFLELAFVEVSTDGIAFVRFPSVSEIQTDTQTAAYEKLDARLIHNLAGKYTMLYGTPFDLEDIKDLVADTDVDADSINYVKIISISGCISDDFASYDAQGHKINDPYPTPFASGGFDLDAVGVINNTQNNQGYVSDLYLIQNPVSDKLLYRTTIEKPERAEIISLSGKCIAGYQSATEIDVSFLISGVYILKISGSKSVSKLFIKM